MKKLLLDKFGICASSLCLFHCIVTPFIIFIFPSTKLELIANIHIHELFAILVIALIIFSIYPHLSKQGSRPILAFAGLGIMSIILGIILEENSFIHYTLTSLGSVSLIIAHFKNLKTKYNNCSQS